MTEPTPPSGPTAATNAAVAAVAPDSPAAITRTSVLAFFAADHVAVTPDAKLYVNGGFFSLLRLPGFPAVLPTLGVGAVLEIPFQDVMRDHVIRIGLRDSERQQDLPMRVEAHFRSAPTFEAQFGEPQLVPFGVTVPNVEFPRPGAYNLVLWFDDAELKTYRIRVVQAAMVIAPGVTPSPGGPVAG